jgi:predicted XRE-type DNA-binding protein
MQSPGTKAHRHGLDGGQPSGCPVAAYSTEDIAFSDYPATRAGGSDGVFRVLPRPAKVCFSTLVASKRPAAELCVPHRQHWAGRRVEGTPHQGEGGRNQYLSPRIARKLPAASRASLASSGNQDAEAGNRPYSPTATAAEGDAEMSDGTDMVRGSGNLFRNLGHPDADREQLRALLAARIIGVLDDCKLTVRAAQDITGVAAADFSRIRNAKLGRFTIDRLMTILASLSQEVEVTVEIHPRRRSNFGSDGGSRR